MQDEVEEIGRKVMVLQKHMKESSKEPQGDDTLREDASTQLEVEDLSKLQKILDLFDVISQTVCDSEENAAGRSASSEGNTLMAEIVSLRAGQLAMIQDDHASSLSSIQEIKAAFAALGYVRCHGLLDQVASKIVAQKAAHEERAARLVTAAQFHSTEAIKQYHSKRGQKILECARASLSNSRFDHALAFIVKAKRAFNQSDSTNMLQVLEDLNRTVVLEATRMASDSLILEATRISVSQPVAACSSSSAWQQTRQTSARSTASDATESTIASEAPTEIFYAHVPAEHKTDQVEAHYASSDATNTLFARIGNGGRHALNQEHNELEDEIQQLRAGLEATKSHAQDDVVPLHRKIYDTPAVSSKVASVSSVSMSQQARRAHQQAVTVNQNQANTPSVGAGESVLVETLLHSRYGSVDKELVPVALPLISARKESRRASWDFPDIDPALLKASKSGMGGIVGTAMVFCFLPFFFPSSAS